MARAPRIATPNVAAPVPNVRRGRRPASETTTTPVNGTAIHEPDPAPEAPSPAAPQAPKSDPMKEATRIQSFEFPSNTELMVLFLVDRAHDGEATINDLAFSLTIATGKAVLYNTVTEPLKALVEAEYLEQGKFRSATTGRMQNIYRTTEAGQKLVDILDPLIAFLAGE